MTGGLEYPKSMREMAAERGPGYGKNCTILVEDKYWQVFFLRSDSV